jgi:membrane-associated phospholipid phosphatase
MKNSNEIVFFKLVDVIKSPYFFIVWSALAITSYFFVDLRLAEYMHHAVNPAVKHVGDIVTNLGKGIYYIAAFVLLFLFSKFVLRKREWMRASIFLLAATIISGIFCDVLKMLLGRARPVEFFEHQIFGFHFLQFKSDMWSFPSGHATTIAAVMFALSILYARCWLLFFTLILVTAFSRIVVSAHYLSDVMMGMYLGAVTTIWLFDWLQKRSQISFVNSTAFPK